MPTNDPQPEDETPAPDASSQETFTPPTVPIIFAALIKLTEADGRIVLDIADKAGGLGVKCYLDAHTASRLGQRMADRARFIVSKTSDDPLRTTEDTFRA